MKESKFQADLIRELEMIFPECIVLRTETAYVDSLRVTQGIPDIVILFNDTWVALECKRQGGASHRPNQDYYIKRFGKMAYSAFIFPENKEEVINEICKAFGTGRKTCEALYS